MNSRIGFARPLLGDEEQVAALSVLQSGRLVHGPMTEAFEEEFASFVGVKHAIAVANCTAGLFLLARAAEVKGGDNVLVPALTHVATAVSSEMLGITTSFVDSSRSSGGVDLDQLIYRARGSQLVYVVHFLGVPVDVEAIRARLPATTMVVEDCALSLGSMIRQRCVGSLSDAGVFSFYPAKHLCSIEGGMVTTDDDALADVVRKQRSFGYDKPLDQRTTTGEYDVVMLGSNLRMSEVEAAIGRIQLRRQNEWMEQRRATVFRLLEVLEPYSWCETIPNRDQMTDESLHVNPYCLNLILNDEAPFTRDQLTQTLLGGGVETSRIYPRVVPDFTYFKQRYGFEGGEFPVAERLAARSLSLPVGPHLSEADVLQMIDLLQSIAPAS